MTVTYNGPGRFHPAVTLFALFAVRRTAYRAIVPWSRRRQTVPHTSGPVSDRLGNCTRHPPTGRKLTYRRYWHSYLFCSLSRRRLREAKSMRAARPYRRRDPVQILAWLVQHAVSASGPQCNAVRQTGQTQFDLTSAYGANRANKYLLAPTRT